MSGRRQKKLRKQQNRDEIFAQKMELKRIASLPVIPVSHIVEYLTSMFVGKSGYHYISISKVGSLFLQKEYENIVPIMLHNSFPIMSATGRFNDRNKKDMAIGLVKVTPEFPGLIIDRHCHIFLNGCSLEVLPDIALPQLCDLGRVSFEECSNAIKSQEKIFQDRMKQFTDMLTQGIDKLRNDPYADPFEDPYAEPNPYVNVMQLPSLESESTQSQ